LKKTQSVLLICALILSLLVSGCSSSAKKAYTPEQFKLTPEKAQEMAKQGVAIVESGGDIKEAGLLLEHVVKTEPLDAKGYFALGVTRYQKKDYQGALEAYDKSIQLDPKVAGVYQAKANVLRDQKNLKEAEVWYRKAWAVNPQFVGAYTELGLQLSLANRAPEAVTVLKEGMAANPNNLPMAQLLASIAFQAGMKDEAKAAYNTVLKLDPNNAEAKDALSKLN